MDDTKADVRTGAVLNGRYRVVELLGEGGMGLVYRGERLQLGRPVAIKFLHSPYAKSAKFVARFEREARAMSRLSHPHCVSVIDFGMHDAPYIVMDFVTGATLRDVLDRGPVSVPRALSIARQVLLGLAHAHQEGIVHRDIKPGNIMLAYVTGMDDQVRIFDFGLAKLQHAEGDGDASTASVVGTPAYMAPEQASAGRVDPRADLYAVGIVLFEMLAGHKPFQGDDAFTVLCMQRDTLPPRLEELKPALSPSLCAVVAKALSKEPEKRFQSASDFIEAIDSVPDFLTADRTGRNAALGAAATLPQGIAPAPNSLDLSSTSHILPSTAVTPRPGEATETSFESIAPAATHARSRPRKIGRWLLTGTAAFVLGVGLWQREAVWAALGSPQGDAERAQVAQVEKSFQEPQLGAQEVPPQAEAEAPRVQADAPPPSAPTPHTQDGEQAAPVAALDTSAQGVPVEPAAPPALELAAAAEAEPSVPQPGEAIEAPEPELSEAQLAAADKALDEPPAEPRLSVSDAAPPKARTVAAARALARAGNSEDAIAALRAMRKKKPKDAELPTAIGDLYFERGWWSDAMSKYREAIKLNPRFKKRESIARNAVRALDDTRVYPKARALLVKDIGRSAIPRLKKAAKSGTSKALRTRAGSVLAALR